MPAERKTAETAATVRAVEHGSFTIERYFEAPVSRVYGAWTTSENKLQWFFCAPDWEPPVHDFDFRIGGRETNRTGPKGGQLHLYDARYEDIVPDSRIVLAYTMTLGELRISSSLLTLEFYPEGSGTRFFLTEQMVVMDSRWPVSSRLEGTEKGIDNLERWLRDQR